MIIQGKLGIGGSLKSCFFSHFFEYETPKVVEIKSRFLGVLNRLVQITIIAYVIVWVFAVNHGYQYVDSSGVSGITTKVKGVVYTNSTDKRIGNRIWDIVDLIVPVQQDGALFVTTNVLMTHNQQQGICPEQEWNKAECKNDSDCLPAGKPYHLGHGVSSGKCNKETGTCMVRAWCPLENDTLTSNTAAFEMSKDFTVFIKNHIYFPHYKKARSNLIEFIDKKYLRSCNYHPVNEPYCPIFRLADMVSLATDSESSNMNDDHFKEIAVKGGVISVRITWDCNFDYDERECKPVYKFDRLDNYGGNSIAEGHNIRHAYNFVENGVHKRQLVKAYGILFLVKTDAKARAFDIVTFFRNLGAGLALLGIASICCDIYLLYFHKKRVAFKRRIYELAERNENRVKASFPTAEELDDMVEKHLSNIGARPPADYQLQDQNGKPS